MIYRIAGDLVTAYCYENVTIRKIGLFDEEMFRSGRGVAGGWPWPLFLRVVVHISEMQI